MSNDNLNGRKTRFSGTMQLLGTAFFASMGAAALGACAPKENTAIAEKIDTSPKPLSEKEKNTFPFREDNPLSEEFVAVTAWFQGKVYEAEISFAALTPLNSAVKNFSCVTYASNLGP